MITELTLRNFKAFGDTPQRLPIKPLTLIFGANSSGKSSIIHGLLYFEHAMSQSEFRLHRLGLDGRAWTIRKPNLDVHQPKLSGNLVDLGGFASFVHGHQIQQNFGFGIQFDLRHPVTKEKLEFMEEGRYGAGEVSDVGRFKFGEASRFVEEHQSIGIRLDIGRTVPNKVELWPEWKAELQTTVLVERQVSARLTQGLLTVQRAEVSLDGQWVARFERTGDGVMGLVAVNDQHNWVREKLITEQCDLSNPEWTLAFEAMTTVLPEFIYGKHPGFDDIWRRHVVPLQQLCTSLRKVAVVATQRLSYLGGIRVLPPRLLVSTDHNDPNWRSAGLSLWHSMLDHPDLVKDVNAWLADPAKLQSPYRLELKEYADVSSLAAELENLAVMRSKGGEEQPPMKAMLERLARAGWRELALVDQRTSTAVSHRDVGLGLSQFLPVLVNALASQEEIIAIEQPEIHLHPALQAELGDVFIESALGERKNTFLLETHSEHLILRILRRVRETTAGTLPPGMPPVRPEDVSVAYVQPGQNGSEIIELPVTPDGDFGRPWPGGFFAERFQDLP